MEPVTVVKFGGTSLATADQIRKAVDIVRADPARRYVVVSAPGKRSGSDTKVTDLLYSCYDKAVRGSSYEETLRQIESRFSDIIDSLGVSFDITEEMSILRAHLETAPLKDYMASRGEYLNAKIIAAYLDYPFIDASETIFFREDGSLDDEKTYRILGDRLNALPHAVIPGFFGVLPNGEIHTFSRGGSDVTGSIAARSVHAALYENWTDVSGMLSADPRIVDDPRVIEKITYTELRELSYMGASVLHEDAIFPVRKAGIPINIRNTNRPQDPGTLIAPSVEKSTRKVTGIAGKKGFSGILVEKSMMNARVGFTSRLLQILAEHGVSFEHCPTGIDTISIIVSTDQLKPVRDDLLKHIQKELEPETLLVDDGFAMIAVVGRGMVSTKGTAARIFKALADSDVNIRMIDQGSSELNIIVGVDEADYETAIRSIYHEMESLMY